MNRCVYGSTGDRDLFTVLGSVDRGVDSGTGGTELVSEERRLDTSAIFTFDVVNGRVVGLVMTVNLNG